jgi:hypothetical protein
MPSLLNRFNQVIVNKKLKMGKGAQIVATSAAGVETVVDMTELAALGGVTATAAELNTMTGILATTDELNAIADASTRVITTTATALNLAFTTHGDKVILINSNSTVANTFTLPLATGTGTKITLINNIAQTQGTVVIAANGTTNTLSGVARVFGTTAMDAEAFVTSATSDKISFNLTTTGGKGGDIVEAWDTATGVWTVQVYATGSGALATPFSQT